MSTSMHTARPVKTPKWLYSRCPEAFPKQWAPIAQAFVQTVELLLGLLLVEKAHVNFLVIGAKLEIRFGSLPRLTRPVQASLRDIAARFERMANESLGSTGELLAISPSVAVPFAVESDDFDLVMGPDASEDVCQASSQYLTRVDTLAQPGIKKTVQQSTEDSVVFERQIHVFDGLQSPAEAVSASVARDKDTAERLKKTMKRLIGLGPTRPLRMPAHDWCEQLSELETNFPNFTGVINSVVRPHLYLVSRGVPHRMPPLLLVSGPGAGKTQFARALQSIFALPSTLFIVMAGETNGSKLSGSSTFWSNSSPGSLFERLAWTAGSLSLPPANPLVVIDEIDKVGTSRENNYDPLAALYSLLEEETARQFEDQSVPGVLIDASLVRFVLTANDASCIPAPLLSRLLRFDVEMPSAVQMQDVARRMFEALVTRLGVDFDSELPGDVLNDLAGMSPRETKVRLEAAIAIALSTQRRAIDGGCWSMTRTKPAVQKSRMAFV